MLNAHSPKYEKCIINLFFYCLTGNALSSYGHNNGTRLSFDLSEISPNTTQSLMSELHIYKRRAPGNIFNSNLCIITIYAKTVVDGYVLILRILSNIQKKGVKFNFFLIFIISE